MKYYSIVCMACFAFWLVSAETVSKMSASFSFPSVGTKIPHTAGRDAAIFNIRAAFGQTVSLAWSLPDKNITGTIKIYSVSGALIKTFRVNTRDGVITWNARTSSVGKGVYLAVLSCTHFKKGVKILL